MERILNVPNIKKSKMTDKPVTLSWSSHCSWILNVILYPINTCNYCPSWKKNAFWKRIPPKSTYRMIHHSSRCSLGKMQIQEIQVTYKSCKQVRESRQSTSESTETGIAKTTVGDQYLSQDLFFSGRFWLWWFLSHGLFEVVLSKDLSFRRFLPPM